MKYDVVTIGGAVRDFTFYIKEGEVANGRFIFPVDSKTLAQEAYFTNGGGAQNVAVGLARFGLKVAAISRVGKDLSGQIIINNLKKNKIDAKRIQIDPKIHTGVSVIIQKRGEGKVLFTFRGASDNLILDTRCRISDSRWIYIASLTGDWERILNRIYPTSGIHHPTSRIVWNPGAMQLAAGKKKLAKFLKKTEILILNRHEAAQLLLGSSKSEIRNYKSRFHRGFSTESGEIPNSKFEFTRLLKGLYKLGPKMVVITAGRRGAYVYDRKIMLYQPSTGNKPKDATGAGDAFSSGFLAGLILFNDLKKALKLGILNSGSVIREIGAQNGLLNFNQLKKLKFTYERTGTAINSA